MFNVKWPGCKQIVFNKDGNFISTKNLKYFFSSSVLFKHGLVVRQTVIIEFINLMNF